KFDNGEAYATAREFFRDSTVRFAGIDGTMYSRPLFDMVIFFGGAYASTGNVIFREKEAPLVKYDEKTMQQRAGISSVVPIYINEIVDLDQAFYGDNPSEEANPNKPFTDESIIDNSTIANWIMTFSEYYLAHKLASDENKKTRIILLDRSLSIERASLLYDTSKHEFWKTKSNIIGYEIDGEAIDENDLILARQHVFNRALNLPPARGDYLLHAITNLIQRKGPLTLKQILFELSANDERRAKRARRNLTSLVKRELLREESNETFVLNPKYNTTWERISKLVTTLGDRFFFSGSDKAMKIVKANEEHWLTTLDIAFLTLFTLNMLMEECWKKHILLIGMTKDTAARDFKRQLVPILRNEGLLKTTVTQETFAALPNTDRMILQSASIFNPEKIKPPWSLVEYDSAVRTMVLDRQKGPGYVSGAIKNRIALEKTFLKTYVQLSQARADPMLRSNVLLIDRLIYPEHDYKPEKVVTLQNEFGGATEPVELVLFKDKNVTNVLQNLVMNVLVAMAPSSIPEAFGHNKPLFIADKIAKWNYSQFKCMVDTTANWMLNNHRLRKFIFYMSTFRERRASIESARRENT
ncbi:MAG TPA: hypothetical protein VMT42_01205, partial [candidate division Zixibacteria bacterium]|nr:hypothetical protein [candidate division Zixibacteria bacterium]